MNPLRLHRPSVAGRARADVLLLLFVAGVVALTGLLSAAVPPAAEHTSDRAVADTVRQSGSDGDLVATIPFEDDTRSPTRVRDPGSVAQVRQAAALARLQLPRGLDAVVRPGVASVSSTELHVLREAPGQFLRLAYVVGPRGAPAVTWTSGGPPRASGSAGSSSVSISTDGTWPVQVALSQAAADTLGLRPGDRFDAEDEQFRRVSVVISGIYTATDPRDAAWQAAPQLLHPVRGRSSKLPRSSAAALVLDESLPDLRLAVPFDDLVRRVVFTPQPEQLRFRDTESLVQSVVGLKASAVGNADGSTGEYWDSLLDRVLLDAHSQVTAARAQATVLLVGLLTCAGLVLVLAAQLLVRRRTGALVLERERGAALLGIGTELFVEAGAVAVAGTAVGVAAAQVLVGGVSVTWTVPVLVVAAFAGPVLGVLLAARATRRRVPANRSARRTAARAQQVRRILVETAVALVAAASFVALQQRGVLSGGGQGSGADLLSASAPIWLTILGAVVVLRLVPLAVSFALARSRRSSRGVPLFAAAGAARTATRALPFLIVVATTAQLTLCLALAATEQHGQAAGAWLQVGADARLQTDPDGAVQQVAEAVAAAPGVRGAVAARVADGVPAASAQTSAVVRLVVVDSAAFERLLAASPLPDAPQLARLRARGPGTLALLRGGDPALREGLRIGWDDTRLPLNVVGTAPAVGTGQDPVVVVDAEAFAATGAVADPGTVWAVGPGAASAIEAAAARGGTVVLRDDVLQARRDAPLASGLHRLAVACGALLLLFAILSIVLAAWVDAPVRGESLGRLRSLGLRADEMRRVLGGELVPPVLLGAVTGLALGIGCAATMFAPLALERITGQTLAPVVMVPWWTAAVVAALLVAVLAVTQVESITLRRKQLAQLLRES
ncbi:FtsX-like permease family protein [Angustibacter sp. McL0619]|uniref:FtsX-like permease family protein n=1 Tax=Angustibacter sp. McL0619 TaxID=3415676 RepID=UPI003CEB167D